MDGGCSCGAVRYRLTGKPLFVHCCHCRHCQRETGSAFAHNGMIESDRIKVARGMPAVFDLPTASGKGQRVRRCSDCGVALWSTYGGPGPLVSFVKIATLDEPDRFPPQAHMFTASTAEWMVLPDGVPAAVGYYDRESLWPKASLERLAKLLAGQT